MKPRNAVVQFIFDAAKSKNPLSEQGLLEIKSLIKEIPNLVQARYQEIASYQRIKQASPEIKIDIPEEISIDIQDEYGDTALTWAAYQGHQEIAHELIEAKAALNIQNKNGETALILAAFKDLPVITHKLIKAKANLDIQNRYGDTALTLAANQDHQAIMHELIEAEAALDIKNIFGNTALIVAVLNGHQAKAHELIKAGAKLELQNKEGYTALDEAINYIKISAVSLLLSHGALVRHPQKFFEFLEACDQRDTDVLASLQSLCEQLRARLTIKEDKAEAKQSDSDLFNKADNYLKKLNVLTNIHRNKLLKQVDEATDKIITPVLLDIVAAFDVPLQDPRVSFFKPAEIDSLLPKPEEKEKRRGVKSMIGS